MTSDPGVSKEPSPATSPASAAPETADPVAAPPPPAGRAARGARPSPPPAGNRAVLVVPGLLVVALALLVVGLITSGSRWLAASLVASVLAAVLLVIERIWQARKASRSAPASAADASAEDDLAGAAPPIDLDAPSIDPDDPEAVWVVDGRPRYHTRDCATIASLDAEPIARSQALEDGFVACSLCAPAAPAANA